MSYQVLARKWRPQNFEQLVGQEHVLGALVNALENERLHHAYLFSGTRGVGKTTIARILARSLNCETGITAKPCGECPSCQEISEGRFVDLIEVDAASRTKVEDTRDLLENVQYRPTRGRFKIYLIDEVHMLSNHSFNALLKTLEEPPEHVKFLLATTDPQKLPVTVLSRCLQFNLKNLPAQRISEYLDLVLNEEKVPFEKSALGHLARAAAGSMRDALSLTDQAISHGGGKLAEQDVVEMLGTVDRKRIYQIVRAICEKDGKALIHSCQDLSQYSVDYLALLEEMLALFHAIAVLQAVPESEPGFGDQEQVAELAQALSPEDVQMCYQMLLMGRKDLVASPDMHLGFEMLMLRLLAFQPETKIAVAKSKSTESNNSMTVSETAPEIAPEIAAEPEEVTPVKKSETAAEPKPQVVSSPEDLERSSKPKPESGLELEPEPNARRQDMAQDQDVVQSVDAVQNIDAIRDQAASNEDHASSLENISREREIELEADAGISLQQSSEDMTAPLASPHVDKASVEKPAAIGQGEHSLEPTKTEPGEIDCPKTLDAFDSDTWIPLFRELPLGGAAKSVISHMVLEQQDNGRAQFRLAEAGQPLFNANHQQRLAEVLTTHFGHPVDVEVELGNVDRETPAENARRLHREALTAAEDRMLNDPLIGEFMHEFQAQLVPDSVTFCDSES